MAMKKKHRKTLATRVLADKKFRAAFLKHPKKAAGKLSIKLSDKDHDKLLEFRKEIMATAKHSDAVRQGSLMSPLFFPIIILK